MTPTTTERYTVEVRENGRRVDQHPIADPFIRTTVRPGGHWLGRVIVAWRVLVGQYEVEVLVRGDREIEEQVLELDPDYLGGWDSERRRAWNSQLNTALRNFAMDEADVDD